MIYQFAAGFRLKGSAQVVGEALDGIRKTKGLNATNVLESASSGNSPLHQYFEWDDMIAARAHRLNQARLLIRSVVQVEDEDLRPIRAFVKVADEPDYDTVVNVLSDSERRERLFYDVQSAIEDLKAKLIGFEDMVDLIDMLDMVHGYAGASIEAG